MTHGYFAFYFSGRFYVFLTGSDAYPSYLGEAIAQSIPTDPVLYHVWLDSLRVWFRAHDELLRRECLLFPDDDQYSWPERAAKSVICPPPIFGSPSLPAIPDFTVREQMRHEPRLYHQVMDNQALAKQMQDHPMSFYRAPNRAYGRKLDGVPTPFSFPRWFGAMWIYILDLERERLMVQTHSQSWIYTLRETPHINISSLENLYDERIFPEVSDEISLEPTGTREPVDDPAKDEELVLCLPGTDRPASFPMRKVIPITTLDEDCPSSSQAVLRRFFFHLLWRVDNDLRALHFVGCQPQDFIYRELVFLFISLAAGEFSFLDASSFTKWEDKGPCLYTRSGTSTFLPAFGSGVHKRGIEGGSAPRETIYWFENVLVSLRDELESPVVRKAAIADAIQFARGTGRRSFHGLLISLWTLVLFRVGSSGVVEYTDSLPLLKLRFSHHLLHRAPSPYPAFVALIHLFAAAEKATAINAGPLPDEIYQQIMDHTDWITYRACAKASRNLARYAKSRLRLVGQNLVPSQNITHVACFGSGPAHDPHFQYGYFIVDDHDHHHNPNTPSNVEWVIEPWGYPRRGPDGMLVTPTWYLVIGDGDRRSLVSGVAFEVAR
ncbi:MAG: hypothetical protein M1826_005334 [Phylliscum demangeonii]|nr:MAG: hypothetical protein M1826_005334 [Phylliscum demangeonii]